MTRSTSILLAAFTFAACAGRPAAPHVHVHATVVTVSDAGLQPAATVSIPTYATVVWRNGGNAPLQVDIDAAICGDCETVVGFRPRPPGSQAPAIPAGGVATMCFHDAGTFAFTATLADRTHRGTITVGGAP